MARLKLSILFLIAFLVGADEFLLGPILTPIGQELAVPPERITIFIAAYSLPLVFLAPLAGALSDRYGRMAVLLPACGLFGLASIATALAPSFEAGVACRVLTGIGSAGMLPVAFAMAGDTSGEDGQRAIAIVQSGLTLGIIVSPGLGALSAEFASWRLAFAGLGGLGLAVALAASFAIGPAPLPKGGPASIAGGLFIPGAFGSLVAMALGLGGAVGVFALVGERLRAQYELDTTTVGIVYALFGATTLIGNLAMPWLVRLTGSGRRAMRLALIGVLGAILIVFAMPDATLMLVLTGLVVWAVLGGAGAPALQSHLAQLSPPRRGVLMALGASALNLGVAIASSLAGAFYTKGPIWVAGLATIFIVLAILALRPAPSPAGAGDSWPESDGATTS
jgi:predicted MFS family arabinose efflux permease